MCWQVCGRKQLGLCLKNTNIFKYKIKIIKKKFKKANAKEIVKKGALKIKKKREERADDEIWRWNRNTDLVKPLGVKQSEAQCAPCSCDFPP